MSRCITLAILSTLHYGASLKVDHTDLSKSPALEATDSVEKKKIGSGLVSSGMASLESVMDQIPSAKIDDNMASLSEGKKFSAVTELHKDPVPTTRKKDLDVTFKNHAVQGSDVASPAPQSVSQNAEASMAAKKQIARGRGKQPDTEKSPWLFWFQQISIGKGIGLVLFLIVGIVLGVRGFSMLQSRCSSKEDSVLEEAWKPKQVTLTSEVEKTVTSLANDTVASMTAAIDAAAKMVEGQSEDPVKERQPRVAPRYSRRHVSCPWPKEPELPAQQEKSMETAETTSEHPTCTLWAAPTVAKVQLNDELGAWIPDVKDVAAELVDSMSHEDSTSAGESDQALLDKLREVASDGEDESVSPRHLRRYDSEENLDEI